MKHVLYYQSASDFREKAPLHFAAHRAHWERFLADGTLLLIGPFANPEEGSMGVFSSHESAEDFARNDPFVLNGVASSWVIREWNEALYDPAKPR